MKIEILDTFCKVVEVGSISQVAKKKFMSQPAITNQIRQLEEVYHTSLFNRNKNSLIITEEGNILYKLLKEIINKYDYSFQMIDELKEKNNDELRIGSSLTIGDYVLPELLGSFKKKHPSTNIKLDITSTPNVLQSLKDDKINIALVEGEVNHTGFTVRKFAEDELVMVCSANHHKWANADTVSLDELEKEKMIWREESSGTRKIIEKKLNEQGKVNCINVYLELGSTQAIKKAVELDLGITILSRLAVERELENGDLKRIKLKGLSLKRDFWMVQKDKSFYRGIEKEFYRYILHEGEKCYT